MGCAGNCSGRDEALHVQTTKYTMMEEGEQVRRVQSAPNAGSTYFSVPTQCGTGAGARLRDTCCTLCSLNCDGRVFGLLPLQTAVP